MLGYELNSRHAGCHQEKRSSPKKAASASRSYETKRQGFLTIEVRGLAMRREALPAPSLLSTPGGHGMIRTSEKT